MFDLIVWFIVFIKFAEIAAAILVPFTVIIVIVALSAFGNRRK